jgi:hypothetical protein
MRISIYRIVLFIIVLVFSFAGAVLVSIGQTVNQLPATFEALLPADAKMNSRAYNKSPVMGIVAIGGNKHVINDFMDAYTDYSFGMQCFADKMWKVTEQTYRAELEHSYQRDLKDATAQICHYKGSGTGAEVYAPDLKSYPWGKGFIQRTDRHEVSIKEGPRKFSDYTFYFCAYYGVSKCGTFTIKVRDEFNLLNADQFVSRCAEAALKNNLDTLGK